MIYFGKGVVALLPGTAVNGRYENVHQTQIPVIQVATNIVCGYSYNHKVTEVLDNLSQ